MESSGTRNVDSLSQKLHKTRLNEGEPSSSSPPRSNVDVRSTKDLHVPPHSLTNIPRQNVRSDLAHSLEAEPQQVVKSANVPMSYRKDGFCDYCRNITIGALRRSGETDVFQDDPVTDSIGGHHHSIHDLEISAEACPLCRLLVISLKPIIEKLRKAPHREYTRFKMWAQNMEMNDDDEEKKLTRLIYQWDDWDSVELLISAFKDTPASAHIEQTFLDPHADSERNFAKIRGILQFCNETHTRCSPGPHIPSNISMRLLRDEKRLKPLPSAVLPTRVVVAHYEDHGKTAPFLMETNGEKGVYAALSYRWSTDSQITTTRLTLESNKKQLDFGTGTGTKTFRDAIALCRNIGIPYLWIDALCIIQHDPTDPLSNLDDWKKEGKDMGRVYGDCALTIAATGASDDSSNGLFGDRSAIAQYVEMPFRLEAWDEPDGIYVISLPPKGFKEEVNDSELYSRGWVMQERLLSHRYLHFGKTQWFWQCRQNTISEVSGFEDQETSIGSNLESGQSESYLDNSTKFVRRWMKIVEVYSRLKFTVATDRFVAIQGIVSETAKTSGDEYNYGMWSKLLYVQLQWFIRQRDCEKGSESEDIQKAISGEHYRPSWSWQSTTKPISYFTQFEGDRFYEKVPNDPLARNYLNAVSVTIVRPAFQHKFVSRPANPGEPARSILIMRTTVGQVNLELDENHPSRVSQRRQDGVIDERYTVTLKARDSPTQWEGKDVGRCNLDDLSYTKYQPYYCIAISENWSRKGTVEELRSLNVLIVVLRKQGENIFAKRIGEGIVSEKSFFNCWQRKNFIIL